MPSRLRVLFVCHGHPRTRPGGAENYALELHEAMRASSRFEPLFLAHRTASDPQETHPRLAPVTHGDPGQFFFVNDLTRFDPITGRSCDERALILFKDLLEDLRPSIVHFQHTLFLGYDLIGAAAQMLPHAPIVHTLHEFLPICHHQGQMLRTFDLRPCERSSPHACNRCFPGISAERFFLRQRYIHSQFQWVDRFIAPVDSFATDTLSGALIAIGSALRSMVAWISSRLPT